MDFFSPLAEVDPLILIAACAIMAFGGFVKGAVGFALPMIAIGGLGSFMPAQDTVAILIFPTVLTNFWQTMRQGTGAAGETLGQFWKLNLLLGLTIGVAAQWVPDIPSAGLFVFLGVLISTAAGLQLAGWRPRAPGQAGPRMALEIVTGLVAGVCGGLSGVWGPPVLFFLIALECEKTLQIRALGLAFTVGSIILVPAHLMSGLLNRATLPFSALMCVPVALGMVAGLRWQDRMDARLFRRLTLVVLCLAGLNLLRRGLT
ncbi:MAG TPA: sulfite exporter TauE/SafE family protein [Thermohalobaculum sp.]|nr:sulfite exporter TauE/SafE family protein [Thermohalobaculum sp.]